MPRSSARRSDASRFPAPQPADADAWHALIGPLVLRRRARRERRLFYLRLGAQDRTPRVTADRAGVPGAAEDAPPPATSRRGDGGGPDARPSAEVWARRSGSRSMTRRSDRRLLRRRPVSSSAPKDVRGQHDGRELLAAGCFPESSPIGSVHGRLDRAGPTSREESRSFWQIAGLVTEAPSGRGRLDCWLRAGAGSASTSRPSPVPTSSTVMGAPHVLGPTTRTWPTRVRDIGACATTATLPPWPSFSGWQPYLGLSATRRDHTIDAAPEAQDLAGQITPRCSSYIAGPNLTIDKRLSARDGLSWAETLEMVLPSDPSPYRKIPGPSCRLLHVFTRMGPFLRRALSALIARHGGRVRLLLDAIGPAAAVEGGDRLGLRLISEPGGRLCATTCLRRKPMAPGENAMC